MPTRGGFVPMKMNKRCTMEIYISRRSLDYTNARGVFTMKMYIRCTMEIYISRRSFDYTNARLIYIYEDE